MSILLTDILPSVILAITLYVTGRFFVKSPNSRRNTPRPGKDEAVSRTEFDLTRMKEVSALVDETAKEVASLKTAYASREIIGFENSRNSQGYFYPNYWSYLAKGVEDGSLPVTKKELLNLLAAYDSKEANPYSAIILSQVQSPSIPNSYPKNNTPGILTSRILGQSFARQS